MDKSKTIFACIAIVIVVFCIFAITADGTPDQITEPTESSAQTITEQETNHNGPAYIGTMPGDFIEPSTSSDFDDVTFNTDFDFTDSIRVNDTVQIHLVDMDPDAVIDRDSYVSEHHPEYISYGDAPSLFSLEGKVYKNDRTISIDIEDRFSGDIYTFTFGYPTGQYNRFLYLNPKCEINGVPTEELGESIQFNFNIGGSGGVANFAEGLEYYQGQVVNYNMTRHLAEYQIANYLDPQHPGAVWLTMVPLDTPAEFHCRVFNKHGYLMGTLALVVEKDEDGCYAFTDIRELDLWEDNSEYPNYTHTELEYIASILQEAFDNREIDQLSARFTGETISSDRCAFVMRTAKAGYYYPTFVNIDPNGSDLCRDVASQVDQTIAVTINFSKYHACGTVYLWVLKQPDATSHGWYQIIGSDYCNFRNQEDLTSGRPEW